MAEGGAEGEDEWDVDLGLGDSGDGGDGSDVLSPLQAPPSAAFLAFQERRRELEREREDASRRAKELRRQRRLLEGRAARLERERERVGEGLLAAQERADRWAQALSRASTDAERERLFKRELERALREGDARMVETIRAHAREERAKANAPPPRP